ncbi:MAG: holo-ACP synthase [Planctomycetes bacterium]|nr:holo-ACP synthase [Planctomycetota bacterium]
MIVAVGVDSVAIARIDGLWRRGGARFTARVLTPRERAYCEARALPAESIAARFCAKEAVMKCLGTGWAHGIGFLQIELLRDPAGALQVALDGAAAARAAALGIRRWHASVTHTADTATAFVVAEH